MCIYYCIRYDIYAYFTCYVTSMLCGIIILGGWSIGHHVTSNPAGTSHPAMSVSSPESVQGPAKSAAAAAAAVGMGSGPVSYSSCGVAFIGDAAHTVS